MGSRQRGEDGQGYVIRKDTETNTTENRIIMRLYFCSVSVGAVAYGSAEESIVP